MKNIFLIAFSLFFAVAVSHAQERNWNEATKKEMKRKGQGKSPEERAKIQTAEMSKSLELTSDQAVEVEAALLDFHSEMEQTRLSVNKTHQNMSPDERKEMKNKHLQAQDKLKNKMKLVLNEDQYASFLSKMGEMQRKMRKRRAEGKR